MTDSSSPAQTYEFYSIIYVKPALRLLTMEFPRGIRGSFYSHYLSGDGGRGPYSLQVVWGGLPPGLSLSAMTQDWPTFHLGGTPTQKGSSTFEVELSDSLSPPDVVQQTYTLRVEDPLAIATTFLPEGWTDQAYSATVNAIGGIPPYKWTLGPLPDGLTFNASTATIEGMLKEPHSYNEWISVRVEDSDSPAQWDLKSVYLRITAPLVVSTSRLAPTRPGIPYRVTLPLVGGRCPCEWRISSGSLPSGLSLVQFSTGSLQAEIQGIPTIEETRTFTVEVRDSGPPEQIATRQLTLQIKNSLGRNNSIATATPISNGVIRASISPYADPPTEPADPDMDYYQLRAAAGALVTLDVNAIGSISPSSPLDPVLEVLDADGNQYTTCDVTFDNEIITDEPCLNDDSAPWTLDPFLHFRVPGDPGTIITFYGRIFEWRGMARPDFHYELEVFGAQ